MGKPFRYRGKSCIRFTDEFGKRRKNVFEIFSDASSFIGDGSRSVRTSAPVSLRHPSPARAGG